MIWIGMVIGAGLAVGLMRLGEELAHRRAKSELHATEFCAERTRVSDRLPRARWDEDR